MNTNITDTAFERKINIYEVLVSKTTGSIVVVGHLTYEEVRNITFKLLDLLGKKEIENIVILLNTLGGSSEAVFGLSDTIALSPKPVHIIANGACFSAGVELICSSKYRYCTKHTVFLFHEITSPDMKRVSHTLMKGELSGLEIVADYTFDIVQKYTNIDRQLFDELNYSTNYLKAEKAIELGIVSEILEPNVLLDLYAKQYSNK